MAVHITKRKHRHPFHVHLLPGRQESEAFMMQPCRCRVGKAHQELAKLKAASIQGTANAVVAGNTGIRPTRINTNPMHDR